ncbi:MAG: DedA family protein [Planctomycetes bacterium]|nr:DedA family protein [Planctomycetota bacterium]
MQNFILTNSSYLGIVLLLLLTGAGLPVPEEMIIVAAGVLSSPEVGRLDPFLAASACLIGVLAGDYTVYGIGCCLRNGTLRQRRWLAWFSHMERAQNLESLVQKHGLKIFLLARFLTGVRAPFYLTLGMLRLDIRRFLLYDSLSGVLVVGVFFLASYFGGTWITDLVRESQSAATVVALVVLVASAGYYVASKEFRARCRFDECAPGETRPNDSETS